MNRRSFLGFLAAGAAALGFKRPVDPSREVLTDVKRKIAIIKARRQHISQNEYFKRTNLSPEARERLHQALKGSRADYDSFLDKLVREEYRKSGRVV